MIEGSGRWPGRRTGRYTNFLDTTSGFLAGGRAASHTRADATSAQVAALAGQPCETITVDRGKGFAGRAEVAAALSARMYFALPHHPWQRGTNENTNGLMREYFPKGTDFAGVGDDEVAAVYDALNRRPRKRRVEKRSSHMTGFYMSLRSNPSSAVAMFLGTVCAPYAVVNLQKIL